MHIAWLVPHLQLFGAIREMVEVCNVMVAHGHQVTIYTPTGEPCAWLTCRATVQRVSDLYAARPDVLIGVSDWIPEMHKALDAAQAKVKCIVVMGFPPTADVEAAWTGKRPARGVGEDLQRLSLHRYHVLTDSSWQNAWIEQHVGVKCLPPMGGVNLDMFHPVLRTHSKEYLLVGMSGDPRPRKGLDVIYKAREIIGQAGVAVRFTSYWKRGIAQDKMRDWYSNCDIFMDAERRAGWCNPVAEAMACGAACVSTDIGAVHDFAIDKQTAMLVPVDDAQAMADAALNLLQNHQLRQRLQAAGLERVKQFSYERVVPPLERALQELVSAR